MRTALITGGNRGIGLACARRLQADGFRIAITGRDEAALERAAAELDEPIVYPGFDVTDEAAYERIDVPVDVLVANAGVADAAAVHRETPENLRRILDVNVVGVFLSVRAVLPGMRERGRGRLIAIGSSTGHQGVRWASAYAASKHAVLGLMRSVALEVAGTQITANTVCPSIVDSEMTTEGTMARIVQLTGCTVEEARAQLEAFMPLGRLVTVDEVAAAVSYFAREDNGAVNGQSLIIDGGAFQH